MKPSESDEVLPKIELFGNRLSQDKLIYNY